jgi:hypothetical protein
VNAESATMDRSNRLSPFLLMVVEEERTTDVLLARTVRLHPSLHHFPSLLMHSVFARTAAASFPLFPPSHPLLDPLFLSFLHSLSQTSPSANTAQRFRRAKPMPVSPRLGQCNLVRRERRFFLSSSPSLHFSFILLSLPSPRTLSEHHSTPPPTHPPSA